MAQQAGVGRTTLNRYFTDRAQLVAAVDQECAARYDAAVVRSRPAEGSGRDALLRMCTELIQLGPVLGLVFADNALVDPDTWFDEEDDPLGQPSLGATPTARWPWICRVTGSAPSCGPPSSRPTSWSARACTPGTRRPDC